MKYNKLQFGCGPDLKPDFINIDLLDIRADNYIKFDLSNGLPDSIEDNSLTYVYSSHALEHFEPWKRDTLLKSCLAKLKPGGKIRTVLPDFRSMVTAYLNHDWTFFDILPAQYAPNRNLMEIVNFGCYQYSDGINEHKAVYDTSYAILVHSLAGFTDLKPKRYDTSIDPDCELRRRYSLVIEGIKP